jgi:hypothetical protein
MRFRPYIFAVAVAAVLSASSFSAYPAATQRKSTTENVAAHHLLPCPEWLRTLRARRGNPRLEGQLRFFEGDVWVSAQKNEFTVSRGNFIIKGTVDKEGALEYLIRTKQVDGSRDPDFRGKQLFDEMMKNFGPRVGYIIDTWHKPLGDGPEDLADNYLAFAEAEARGLPPVEAAKQTWTGVQACRHGFCFPVIVADFNDPNMQSDRTVNVEYYKTKQEAESRRSVLRARELNSVVH